MIHLSQSDLREIGVMSVGHRLRILKSIYNLTEVQEIQIGPDRYIPPTVICLQEEELARTAEAAAASASSSRPSKISAQHVHLRSSGSLTLDALPHILKLFEVRDERMSVVENELRRLVDNYSRLREELLPIFRMFKESKPLPMPLDGSLNSPSHHHHHQQASSSPPLSATSVHSTSKAPPQLSLPKGLSSRRKSLTSQQYLSAHNSSNISSHHSPTRPSNSNSTDWLDTSSFYGGSSNSGTLTQPISLSSFAPTNNVVTTTIITPSQQRSGYGASTPTTSSTVITSGSGSSSHSFLPEITNHSTDDADNSTDNNTDTKLYTKLVATSSASSVATPASASKKLFSSSNQQQTGGGALHAKPPLSHSNSLPHPGSHDEYDSSGQMSADHHSSHKPNYMTLATSSISRSNTVMSIPTISQMNNNGQRSLSGNAQYTLNKNNITNSTSSGNTGPNSNNTNFENGFNTVNNSNSSNSLNANNNLLNGMNSMNSINNNGHHSLTSMPSLGNMSSANLSSSNSNTSNTTTNINSNNSNSASSNNNTTSSAASSLTTHRTSDPIKDFNIPPDVPCYKVLPKIAKKHKVRGDACELVVCYDDQERMVGLEEFPLKIFKELQAKGKNPVFMIRESTGVKPGVGFVVNGTPGGLL